MREILFKAKRTDNGKWIEGLLTVMWGQYHIINPDDENTAYPIDTETICQYTGLTDKNGNNIWENDVVKCDYNDYGEKGTYIGKVIFREDTCTFIVTDGKSTDYEWWNEEKEVIGNIFDNAELLEGN